MFRVKQTKNGTELHELKCIDSTKIATYPHMLILEGFDEVGNEMVLIFTTFNTDDKKINRLKEILELAEYYYVEVYKVSEPAFEILERLHWERNEFEQFYSKAVMEKAKADSE